MKEQCYLAVTTDYRPGDLMMRKARPSVYDFRNRHLGMDLRSWWRGHGKPYSSIGSSDNLASLEEVEKVFNEVVQKKEDWEPLADLKGSPEYLNHAAIIRLDKNGDETIERLWVAEESRPLFGEEEEHDAEAPRFNLLAFEDLIDIVLKENFGELRTITGFPNRIVRFPELPFTVIKLADERWPESLDRKRRGTSYNATVFNSRLTPLNRADKMMTSGEAEASSAEEQLAEE